MFLNDRNPACLLSASPPFSILPNMWPFHSPLSTSPQFGSQIAPFISTQSSPASVSHAVADSKVSSENPDVVHGVTNEALCNDICASPFWLKTEPTILTQGLNKLCEEGQLSEALSTLQQEIHIPMTMFLGLLQRCIHEKDLAAGRDLHRLVVESGLEADPCLGSHLIRMFGLFESLTEANEVFCKLANPNVYAWSAVISAHAKLAHSEQAIKLYYQMQQSVVKPDAHVFVAVLKACSNIAALDHGNRIHEHILENGFDSNIFVGSVLIDMYCKCGSLEDAQAVFGMLPERNAVTWNALIAGFTQHGHSQKAFQIFQQMKQEGIGPNRVTFVITLQACSGMSALELGKQIHAQISQSGFESDLVIGNALIDLYSKCGSLEDAHMVFGRLRSRDVVTWSALIAGYARHGPAQEAVHLYQKMLQEGTLPDHVTFVSVLKACSSITALQQGKQVHAQILESGTESDTSVGSTLIDMYGNCGYLENAHMVFNRMLNQDVVAWSTLISGYAEHGHGQKALQLFQHMQQEGKVPNLVTFVCVLKACSSILALEHGKQIHAHIIERGFEMDLLIGTTLISMYGKGELLDNAHKVFERLPSRDVVTWSALISVCAEHGHCQKSIQLFQQMQVEGLEPNPVTFLCILKACSSTASLEQGKHIHTRLIESEIELDVSLSNTLIDMYGKCGSLEDARTVFAGLSKPDTVTWNVLMAGYTSHECGQEALQLFRNMQEEGAEPDQVTFVCSLKACTCVAALESGRMIHAKAINNGFEQDLFVGSALIGMYGKCGSLDNACMVFNRLQNRNVVTWNALIAENAQDNNYRLAVRIFEDMQQEGMIPNDITFLCLLLVCGHVGLVDEGCLHFRSMRDDYGILPTPEHFNSVVDLLGHAGCFCEGEDLLETLPFRPDIVGWTSLLSSCRTHNNMSLGRRCFDRLLLLDHGKAAPYVLMGNIYALAGMQKEVDRIEELRGFTSLST